MEPPLVATQLLRCKFVLPFGASNRKPYPKKLPEKNTVGPNEFTDFDNFRRMYP